MNAVDFAILAVLAVSMLFGLARGLITAVLALVCWIVAFWAAWAFGARVAVLFTPWLHAPGGRLIAGYVACFLAVLLVGAVVGWIAHRLMDRGGLRGSDRLLGMLFGLARGVLLVVFAVLLAGFTALPREAPWWRQSTLLPGFESGAAWVARTLPPGVAHALEIGGRALPKVGQIPTSAIRDAAGRSIWPVSAGSAQPPAAATTAPAARQRPPRGDVGQ